MTIPFPILPLDYCTRRFTPSRKFVAATKSRKPVDLAQLETLFAQLLPVHPNALVEGGEWHGVGLDATHPFNEQLNKLQWRGSVFHSIEDVEPIVVDRDEKSEKGVGVTEFGGACLRRMEYQGLVSAAMIYDDLPAITHFRAVNDRMVACVMESKGFGQTGGFYFYLGR